MKLSKDLLRRLVAVLKEPAHIVTGVMLGCLIVFYTLYLTRIVGTSMQPTVYENDLIISNKVNTNLTPIHRFDVTIAVNDRGKIIIKRLIGFPGEEVRYIDNNLYIDGVLVPEDFPHQGDLLNFSIQLGEDEYFIMGDNREHSRDSRAFGPINFEDIIAVDIYLKLPFSELLKDNGGNS